MVDVAVEEEHGLSHILVDDHEWAWKFALALWAVAGLLFFAVAIPPVRDSIFTVDDWIYDTTYPVKIGAVTAVAWFLSFIGGGIFAWPFRILVAGVLAAKKRWTAFYAWLLALALSEPFIWLLKGLYGRERPPEALVETTTGSFPSGHSIGGAVMAVGLVVAFVPAGPGRRNLELLAAGFAFIMGGSRMYLGAHYLTDVVAGVAFGAAAAVGAAVIVHRFFLRRFIAEREEAYRALQARKT
ncbi:MAG: phosphatase PAP2 family protein [Acidimicrobiia bacterium]|nr:phosphatase PAP2 family protein [Acidimicrobiia bacterium]